MNYNEFADKIKAKYPEYSDMDNRELAEKIVNKYPNDYNDVTFDEPEQPVVLEGNVEKNIWQKLDDWNTKVENQIDERIKTNAQEQLRKRAEWEEKHPILSGFQKDYQPILFGQNSYRGQVPQWELEAKYGRNIPIDEKLKADAKTAGLNFVAPTNIVTDMATGGEGKALKEGAKLTLGQLLKQGARQGLKTGFIGGSVQGLTSSLADNGISPDLLLRPLGYGLIGGGAGAVLGAPLNALAPLISKNISKIGKGKNSLLKKSKDITPQINSQSATRKDYEMLINDDISLANEQEFWNKVYEDVNSNKLSIEDAEKLENYAAQRISKDKPKEINTDDFYKGLKTKIANEKKQNRKDAISILESISGKKFNKKTINTTSNNALLEQKAVGDEVYSKIPEKVKDMFPDIDVNDISAQEEVISRLKDIVNNGGYSETEREINALIEMNEQGLGLANAEWEEQVKKLFGNTENFEKLLESIKERGLSQSVMNAKGLPKEVKDIIANDLPQYRVLHNNDLTARAVEEIEKDFNNELSRLTSAKDFDALDYEKSRQIVKRLFDLGRHKEAVNLIDNVSINATEKGQAIQALSLWSNMTPEGAVYKAEKLITDYNKKFPKRKKLSLTPEQIDNIRTLQEEAINTTDDTLKAQALARTVKYISELVPSGIGKKLKAYRNISLLLNPKTLGRNIVGNVLFNTVDTVSKGLAVPFDRAIGLVTKQNTRVMPQLNKLAQGGWQGAKTGLKEAIEGIDTRGLGQRFDLNSGRTFENPIMRTLETGLDIGLRVPDRIQYEATFAESVANMMKAQGLKEPTTEILEQAEKEALESVFQNQSKLADLTLGLRKGFNKLGVENFGIGDLLVPYAQTPANLAQQGINYSPLGFIKGIGNALQGNQRQASLDLARATLGTGLMGGGYLLGKNKLATSSQFEDNYIKNRDVKNNLQTIGIRPDQLGDMWYAPFQPMSIPLSVGIASAYGNNPLQAGVNTLFDLPFLQNFSRGISDIKDKGIAEAGINFAGSIPAQFVPTGLSQVAQLVDPYLRETSADSKIMQGINQAITKVPFASKTLPAKYDVTGKPVERYSTNGAQRLFDIFVNPTFINKKSDDPVVNELKDLYEETKETKHFLKTADKTLTRVFDENGNPLKLRGKRYSEYQKALGKKMYEEFDYLMGSDKYKNASAEDKVEMLNDRRKVVKQLVEYEMFNVPVSKQYKNKVKKLYINMEE